MLFITGAHVYSSFSQLKRHDNAEFIHRRYSAMIAKGQLLRAARWFVGQPQQLANLDTMLAGRPVLGQRSGGIQNIDLNAIQGSENRNHDFDREFRPLHDTTWARWHSVALAWHQDRTLPPIELIQVGTLYVVRDGHHRVSVARAFGQREIDAVVTVLQVAA